MDYNEDHPAVEINMDVPIVFTVREVRAVRLKRPSSPALYSQSLSTKRSGHQGEQSHLHVPQGTQRTTGYLWTTKIRPQIDIPDRHELFLLGDGERKIEMETVTQVANAALFTFNKEDHTLANMLRDKLFRMEHITFAAYKVPHPLFATFQLRVHTDGEITPKAAIIKACGELITELQELDQEFTKEFELKKMAANVPNGGLDI